MKYILSIAVFFFLSFLLKGQNHRFTYEYTFVKDSLQPKQQTKELMNLDIAGSQSYFYSAVAVKFDSLMEARAAQNNRSFAGIQFSEVPDIIIKKYPEISVTQYKRVGPSTYYKLLDNEKITWRILPEKKPSKI